MVLAVLFLILKYIAVLKKFNLLLERIRDSEVNDVYVPVQQFFLQGSDLDIDKVYLLGYGVNSSGKLVVNSKLADYAEYSYDELMDLLPPNGHEYELSETVDDNTYLINSARLSSES